MPPETLQWLELAKWAVPFLAALAGGYAVIKKQTERHEKSIEAQAVEFRRYLETERLEERAAEERRRVEAKDDERIRRAEIEAFSQRMDDRMVKFTSALTSVQALSEEASRQARAAHARQDESDRERAAAREAHARLEEQVLFQKSIIADMKRTQELRLDDVLRAMGERNA
jgi:hypothetical protein